MTELSRNFPPQIDLYKHAENGFAWQGSIPFERFSRLAALPELQLTPTNTEILANCTLSKRAFKMPWLKASASVTVHIQCQRCLQALPLSLQADINYALVADDEHLSKLHSDEEYVIFGQEHIIGEAKAHYPLVNLLGFIEDELLVLIPLAAKHQDCQPIIPGLMVSEAEMAQLSTTDATVPTQANPFAALAALTIRKN